MKKIAFLLLIVAIFLLFSVFNASNQSLKISFFGKAFAQNLSNDALFAQAFAERKKILRIAGEGFVIKILPDDNEGSRHQKFILKLRSGQTLLMAHNIDIAPRIHDLKLGDSVSFSGILERNERGGVLHWTHKDPDKIHADGWLKHQEKIYQ